MSALGRIRRRLRHAVWLNLISVGAYAGYRSARGLRPSHHAASSSGDGVISLEASCLERRISGLERYVDRLSHALAVAAPERRFRLYTRVPHEGLDDRPRPGNLEERSTGPHGRYLASQVRDLVGGTVALHHVPWQDFFGYHNLPLRWAPRSVITVHDLINLEVADYHPAWERELYRRTLARSTRWASRVIVDSAAVAAALNRELGTDPDRIRVVPLGVEERFSARGDGTGDGAAVLERHGVAGGRYVFCLAKAYAHKNLETLVEAFAHVAERAHDLRLVLGGERYWQPTVDAVDRLVRERGLGDRVRWLGHVPDDDLPFLYRGAGVFAFPSRQEGFGLPVLEALASGTPVVCARATSLPEVAGPAALYHEPDDAAGLGSAMLRVLDDPELARDLSARGRARAREFSWARTAAATLDVYREVLGEPGAHA